MRAVGIVAGGRDLFKGRDGQNVILAAIWTIRCVSSKLTWVPKSAPKFRRGFAEHHIIVDNAAATGRGVRAVTVDATDVPDGEITLMDDGKAHAVRVELG